MSLDSALRSIAYSESRTHGAAMVQIARRRMNLEAAMRANALHEAPVASKGAALERALASLETANRIDFRA